jgi:hypothetical protein
MVKSLFGFGSSTSIEVEFGEQAASRRVSVPALSDGNTRVELPLFMNLDNITGVVHVKIRPGKRLEHQGIKIELIGQVSFSLGYFSSNSLIMVLGGINPGTWHASIRLFIVAKRAGTTRGNALIEIV